MIKYYKHKDKEDVICEVIGGGLRFGKWVWKGNTCSEVYKWKELTNDFYTSFNEITQTEYNHIWGLKLNEV